MNQEKLTMAISCECGKVSIEGEGKPIVVASCYCSDCQEAARRFQTVSQSATVQDSDGGTPLVLFRKDRVTCIAGEQFLEEHRLEAGSPTRRVVATCCASPMFMDFTSGHWLSLFWHRCESAPPIEMRVMAGDRKSELARNSDIPTHAGHTGLMGRLLLAWARMGFRRPKFPYGLKG